MCAGVTLWAGARGCGETAPDRPGLRGGLWRVRKPQEAGKARPACVGPGRRWTVCKEGGPGHGVPMKDKSTNPLSGGGGRTHPVLPLGRGGWGKRWRKAAVGAWPTGPPSFLKETGGAGKTPDGMGRVQFSPQLSAFLGGEGKGLFCGWRRVCRCKHGHVLRV